MQMNKGSEGAFLTRAEDLKLCAAVILIGLDGGQELRSRKRPHAFISFPCAEAQTSKLQHHEFEGHAHGYVGANTIALGCCAL